MNRSYSRSKFFIISFGFFFQDFRSDKPFSGIGFVGFKLAISFGVALIPSTYDLYVLSIGMLLFLQQLYTIKVRPFQFEALNQAKIATLQILILLLFNASTFSTEESRTVTPVLIHVFLYLGEIIYLIGTFSREVKKIRKREKEKSLQTDSTSSTSSSSDSKQVPLLLLTEDY